MTLATRNLTIKLGGKPVVDNTTLSFGRGKVTAILGPNGAGKTSLIRALAGLIVPASGAVSLDAAPLPPLIERARRIGYLPQTAMPAWNVTVRELVGLGRLPHRSRFVAPTDKDAAAIRAALAATDTAHLSEQTVDTLSGGERARVSIARVLAGEPDWIIADEPLANLDPPHQRDLLLLLRAAAQQGAGVIVVLHQLNAAARVADDVVIMRQGCVIAHGDAVQALNPDTLDRAFDMRFDFVMHEGATIITPSERTI
jgi:iron complex transport system ATP-binding protein